MSPPTDETWRMWPLPCAREERERGLRDPDGAEEVGLQLVAQLVLRELLHHAVLSVARVVHHHVESPEVSVRACDRRENRRPVGDVERDREHPLAVGFGEVGEARGVARGPGNTVAAVQGCDGPLSPQPGGRPRDEPRLLGHGADPA